MRLEILEKPDANEDQLCFLCGTPSKNKCSYCDLVYYCGDPHFKLHRPEELCFPFKISQRKNVGQVMVATRDIEPLGTECEILQTSKNKEVLENPSKLVDYVCAIAPLRLLLLRDTNPDEFERLDCNLRDDFKEEEIERASGIFWTNAFSCSNGGGQAVFPTFSFVSHSCTSNCDHTVFPQRHLVLQSKVHIAAGTELNINYISPIQGRLKRQLGSHLSSHLCEFCGEILLPSDPLIMDSNYVCPSGHSKSSEEILSFEHKVTLEMKENITKNDLESFYKIHGARRFRKKKLICVKRS
ncbi:unnamed protein product [Lepeophtheirus salmonis]|uniref:(salmon louse) hypothetical protein n=1 Tax=Lepeophtheirus salmonis TaxID=72036 RepID=A0A7R8H6G3_LEPSM|nr:unnamed protein product [Lepeophtheirus salmonis]CAF2899024.1 unnamed protein product [Lepeophtheirus salmonis]